MGFQDNKFARLAKHNFDLNQGVTIDAQLSRLEEDIRRLKIEFDTFFNGSAKSAPFEAKSRVEFVIKRLSDDRSLTFAQRYLFNTLVARYTAFNQIWRRQLRSREEGVKLPPSHVRALQAEPVADSAIESGAPPPVTRQNSFAAAPGSFEKVFNCRDVQADVGLISQVYDALREAKQMCGERTDDLPFARFQQVLAEQTATLKQRAGYEKVSFTVGVENGKVKFKARGEK